MAKRRSAAKTADAWRDAQQQIIAALDLRAEYIALGVAIAGNRPNARGWLECHAIGGEPDANPSAAINVAGAHPLLGRYKDSRGTSTRTLSLFDFAAAYGPFATWEDARKHFADKASVKLPADDPDSDDRRAIDRIDRIDWHDMLAGLWLETERARGISLEALKSAGGQLAKWPAGSSTPSLCVALPAYGPHLAESDPTGFILWNQSGRTLPLWRKDKAVEQKKMLAVGNGWIVLGNLATAEIVWKTEGPTDLLAFWTAALADPAAAALIAAGKLAAFTNACGASEHPDPALVALLAGKIVYLCHDADTPGELGATEKWLPAIAAVAREVRHVRLPYELQPDHGRDVRDYLADDGHGWSELQGLAEGAEVFKPINGRVLPRDSLANASIEYTAEGSQTAPLVMSEVISGILQRTGDWPRRVDSALFVHDNGNGIGWLESSPAMFGWVGSKCGLIEWHRGLGYVSKEETFHEMRRTATKYAAVEYLPHEPLIQDHYYACDVPPDGDGEAITELVNRFSPETEADKYLIMAMFATVFWGGKGGSRPAFVVTSNVGRGAGKSKLTDMVSYLAGGHIELSQSEDVSIMRQRLLSPEGLNKRIARLDNVKSLRFSWSDLESLITAPSISGKRMYVGEGNRPNTLTWLITLNGISLSTDMAQRSVIVRLKRPSTSGAWEAETAKFIDDNRAKIIGDLMAFLKLEPEPLDNYTRWAAWETSILARLKNCKAIQQTLAERCSYADAEAEEIVHIEEFFYAQLVAYNYEPDADRVHIASRVATDWYNQAMNERRSTINVSKIVTQFIQEGRARWLTLNPSRTYGRGFIWAGSQRTGSEDDADYELETRIARRVELNRRK